MRLGTAGKFNPELIIPVSTRRNPCHTENKGKRPKFKKRVCHFANPEEAVVLARLVIVTDLEEKFTMQEGYSPEGMVHDA